MSFGDMDHNVDMSRARAGTRDVSAAAYRMAFAVIASGTGHFAAPARFDSVLPEELPGNPRCYTQVSGLAEVIIGVLLLVPGTRRLGGRAALVFFVVITPVIINGVRLAHGNGRREVVVACLRLPLQLAMIRQAHKILHGG